MKKKIKTKLIDFLGAKLNISFARPGDDLQLMKLINNNTPGVYVDIGSWHPKKASNTYFFYLRKWKGICIDPNKEDIDSEIVKYLEAKDYRLLGKSIINQNLGNLFLISN